jgi:hypothetical protein
MTSKQFYIFNLFDKIWSLGFGEGSSSPQASPSGRPNIVFFSRFLQIICFAPPPTWKKSADANVIRHIFNQIYGML